MRSLPIIPPIIGHRGAAADAPENTLASIREAHRQGARMVEFDVKLSGGTTPVPILMHDATLERTTNGQGFVCDYDYAALNQLDAGRGEPIPTLRAVIDLLCALDMDANIEIKPCPGHATETAAATIAVLKDCWPTHKAWPILSSFDLSALKTCQSLWPDCPRGYLIDRRPPDWRDIMQDLAASTLHVGYRHENDQSMTDYVATGLPVLVYTVNDPSLARHLWGLGVRSIFSDCPAKIMAHCIE